MTEKEAQSFLDEIEPFVSDEQFAQLYTSIGNDPDSWFERNRTMFKELPGYRTAYKKVGKPEERLYNIIKDDPNLDYTQQEVWDLMDEAGIESEELMNKALDKIRKDREKSKKTKAELDKEKLAQQYRYARQKAVDEYKHSYLGMDKDNPINKGLNWFADMIISDDTKRAIVEDPNNTAAILANAGVDIGGTALDFAPGYGALLGTGARVGRDIAHGRDAGDVIGRNWVDAVMGGAGAKLSKSFKVKGVKDDAEAATQALGGLTGDVGEAVQTNKKLENILKGDLLGWMPSTADVLKIRSKDFTPRDWTNYVAQFEDTMPETYEFLKGIKYEDRGKLLSKLDEATENVKSFAQNEGEQALVVSQKHPIKYKAVEYGTPAMKQGAVGLSKTTSRAGKQDTPYKTSDPSRMKAERDRDVIDWYKENYADQWQAGFKPRPINGELIMNAWQEGHDEGKW